MAAFLILIMSVILILFAIYIKLSKNKSGYSPKKSWQTNSKEEQSVENVRAIEKRENEKGLMINIDVDGTYTLQCQIYRDGSPSVDIWEGNESYRYNIRTHNWKDGNIPDGTADREYLPKISKIIRDEWLKAWEHFGRPEFVSERKPPVPPPTSIDLSTRILEFHYDEGALSSLPQNYVVSASTGEEYQLDLQNLKCSCPDFIKRRMEFSRTDIRRICKHQAKTIISLKQNTNITNNKMIQDLLRYSSSIAKGVPIYKEFLEVTINEKIKGQNPFYILVPKEDPWSQVLFFTKMSCELHGYNVLEKRWGYHQNPFPAGSRQKYNLAIQKVLGIE